MTTLLNYTITKLIYDSPNSLVYRALRNDDQQPVILKVLKPDYPTSAELTRYQQEYELIRTLNIEGVVKTYGLETHQNSLVIILEDVGGDSLSNLMATHPFSLAEILTLAIKVATGLGQLHAANIIHKDINPSNLVYCPATGQLKIIDFGISTRLSRETPTLKNPNVLEGTLAYLSPEQTGRMNRSLDYRTDFYSLGVTVYELLTNQLPFVSSDHLEVVHSHIAKQPVPVAEIAPHIPPILSDVVMKLMAKNAEDRYQSAFGLKYDLEQILANQNSNQNSNLTGLEDLSGFQNSNQNSNLTGLEDLSGFQNSNQNSNLTGLEDLSGFELAQQDFSAHFHLPQKLYGREAEIQQLLAAFDTVVQGHSQLLLVAGYSGIGKSVLVQEIYKPITETRGYFIAGKFDQFQRNIPYSAVVQAFRDLVRQLLTETQSRLDEWQTQILTAVGNNGQVLIEVIPEVELIIGPQPAVSVLPPTESQNRFNLVFQNFIKVFCQADHPLVMFLDDLQWIDSASLKLMTLMMSDIPHLLLIGAYRDNEVGPTHPLMTTLEDLQKSGRLVQTLTLSPLTLSHLNQLVSDTLHLPLAQTLPLAELVLEKTGGNPFFLGEFLKTLYVEHWLEFSFSQREWQWDLAQIKARNITDNVVELMTAKIQRLPASTQIILKLAASVGNQFDLATLAVISQTSVDSVTTDLWEALREGLVVSRSENYKFVHDRIQQAAYLLIPEEARPALHWQIGQLLKTNLGEVLGERLFEVVDHLNQGRSLATTTAAQIPLVRLNLQAGQQAKSATAYQAALDYLHTGLTLLATDSWQTEYDLTLALYDAAVEAAFLAGELALMQQWSAVVLSTAKTSLEVVKIYEVKILAAITQNNYLEAIALARQGLLRLDISLPQTVSPTDTEAALTETQSLWQGRQISDLVNLPRMTDPKMLGAMRLLSLVLSATFQGQPALFPLIISKVVSLSIQYGNAEQSPFAYAFYGGMVVGGMALEIDAAYQFGSLALQLTEKLRANSTRARTLHVVFGFIKHWQTHLQDTLTVLKEGHQLSLENGDLEVAGYFPITHSQYSFFTGRPLLELIPTITAYLQWLKQFKQDLAINCLTLYWQTVLVLSQDSSDPPNFVDPVVESTILAAATRANDYYGLCQFYLSKLLLSYLFSKSSQAISNANLAESYSVGITGHAAIGWFRFYDSLARLQIYPDSPPATQAELLAKVTANQTKIKHWAFHAPMNYQHKYDLVEAEQARVLGHFEVAAKSYEKAIMGARENEYLPEEALAYELAAKFYLEQGMSDFAQIYLTKAHQRYQRWGALAKVKHLEQNYPQLLTLTSTTPRLQGTISTHLATGHDSGALLDFATVMKANQAISGEIILEKLLAALMKIILQNAGAQTGYLILVSQGKLVVEAAGTLETGSEIKPDRSSRPVRFGDDETGSGVKPDRSSRPVRFGSGHHDLDSKPITGLHSIPLENCQSLSQTIVNYVARTKQSVVLENATKTGQFTHDAYIKQQQPKSILCVPLINQGQLVSIVYLENNLTTGAFTPDRIEVLNLISSQAAISIENARLYAEVRNNEKTLTQFLEAIPVGVGILDSVGNPYFVNQRGQELLGRGVLKGTDSQQLTEAYELYLANTEQIYPPEQLPVLRALQGECASVDDLEVRQLERVIPLEAWGTPIFDENGKVIYAMTAFQDISERKQAEANKIRLIQEQEEKQAAIRYSHEIEEKNTELANTLHQLRETQHQLVESEKMAALGHLVAGVAHEINTPVGIGITASTQLDQITVDFATLYKSGKMSRADLEQYLNATHQTSALIFKNLTRAAELTRSFKQVAVDQTSEQERTVVLRQYINEVLVSLRPKLKNTGYQVTVECDEMIRCTTYPGALSQILTNLIMNSLQHGFQGRSEGQITITAIAQTSQITLHYRDDGNGIAPDVIGKIFDPFFTTNRQGGGTGLGLHIVYNLVTHKLNGTIHCESELGQGVDFILTLPVV